MQLNLTVQKEIGANVLTVAYVGALGRHLQYAPNVNLPVPSGTSVTKEDAVCLESVRRPVITWLTGPDALSAAIRRGVAAELHRHLFQYTKGDAASSRAMLLPSPLRAVLVRDAETCVRAYVTVL
jgi:hypothetical protein